MAVRVLSCPLAGLFPLICARTFPGVPVRAAAEPRLYSSPSLLEVLSSAPMLRGAGEVGNDTVRGGQRAAMRSLWIPS